MPHAKQNISHTVLDSTREPFLKKFRLGYSSGPQRDTDFNTEHEENSQEWSFSTSSEEKSNQSNRCENEGGRGAIDDPESVRDQLGQGDASGRDCNKTSQHPFVGKAEYKADVLFSGTSTSFIEPQCAPSPQEKPVTDNIKAAPSFRIATVELGKFASQSKGEDGMNYELRQFHKELNELESVADADDQTNKVSCTDVDVKQHIDPDPDRTTATHPSNYHRGLVPISQPFRPSNMVSLTSHAGGEPRPHLDGPLVPLNNHFYRDSQAPDHPTIIVNYAIPPPRFQGPPPPTFIVPYGPPPPRFHYPMTFPRPSVLMPQQYPDFNYSIRNEPPPLHGPPAPYNKPFSQGTGERTWQDIQHNDIYGPEQGQFGERMITHMANVSNEQCPGRFQDRSTRKIVLLRGVPGSGKTTLARILLQQSPGGIVLSTDDYFCQENGYTYDVKLLGHAHNWNQNRARRALDDGRSPVIIDNTNIQGWEMKPYVQMAVDRAYAVEFLEPDTWWKQDAHELEKRNTHRVPREKISQMLERFEYDMTVPLVMNSVEPLRVRPNRPPPEARPRWGAPVDCSHNSSSFLSR